MSNLEPGDAVEAAIGSTTIQGELLDVITEARFGQGVELVHRIQTPEGSTYRVPESAVDRAVA